jgi:hypothetical protein
MIVCIFEHVQWRWALNDGLALGYFQVGGPATAGCPGWTSELVAFAANTSTPLNFVSCHNYGGGGNGSTVGVASGGKAIHAPPCNNSLSGFV